MISRREDFWGYLQKYADDIELECWKVMTQKELTAFENKWLGSHGVLARLQNQPFIADSKPTAQKIFLGFLKEHVCRQAKLWRKSEHLFD